MAKENETGFLARLGERARDTLALASNATNASGTMVFIGSVTLRKLSTMLPRRAAFLTEAATATGLVAQSFWGAASAINSVRNEAVQSSLPLEQKNTAQRVANAGAGIAGAAAAAGIALRAASPTAAAAVNAVSGKVSRDLMRDLSLGSLIGAGIANGIEEVGNATWENRELTPRENAGLAGRAANAIGITASLVAPKTIGVTNALLKHGSYVGWAGAGITTGVQDAVTPEKGEGFSEAVAKGCSAAGMVALAGTVACAATRGRAPEYLPQVTSLMALTAPAARRAESYLQKLAGDVPKREQKTFVADLQQEKANQNAVWR